MRWNFILFARAAARQAKRFRSETRGTAAVEFAAGSIVMVMLTMGIFDITRAVQTLITVEHAARVGGRYAVVHAPPSPALDTLRPTIEWETQLAARAAAGGLKASDVDATVTWPVAVVPGAPVTVTVSYPHRFFYNDLISSASVVTFSASSTAVVGN